MKTIRGSAIVLLGCLAGVGLCRGFDAWFTEAVTTSRLSPAESLRAILSERPGSGRGVQLRIESLDTGGSTTIGRWPDEGGPSGTERLIWSKDGTKLLVVGRHFFVKDDLFLDNGDQAFLFYDVRERRGWCNSDPPSQYPQLKAEQIEAIEFTEPVRLKPR